MLYIYIHVIIFTVPKFYYEFNIFFFTWCSWWYCLLFSVCFFIFTSSSSSLLSISGMTIFHVTSFIPVKVLLSLIHYFCYIHHHNNLVNIVVSSKNRTRTLDLRKNGTPKKRTCWKNQTSGTKNFVVCLLSHEDSAEMFHVDVQSRGVQGFIFVQIAFEKCTTIFYFEYDKVSIKTTIAKL